MLDLGSTDFHIPILGLPRNEFKGFTTRLFEEWEVHLADKFALPDYSLLLTVEEGSIKGRGKIVAVLAAVYFGIGEYGDFISGVQQIRSQVAEAGNFLADQAHKQLRPRAPKPKVRKHGGSLAQLQRIFVRVQRQELSVDEAMIEAEALFGEELLTEPDFAKSLRKSLAEAPRYPKQLPLPLDDLSIDPTPVEKEGRRPPRAPRPIDPPPLHLRVEIWRESKKGKRKIRVTEI